MTAYGSDARADDIGCQPPPFNYQPHDSYTKQLLLQAVIVVLLAAIAVNLGLSLTTVGA
jgi:hypothetical protein